MVQIDDIIRSPMGEALRAVAEDRDKFEGYLWRLCSKIDNKAALWANSPSKIIAEAFNWELSPEGKAYWKNLYVKLHEQEIDAEARQLKFKFMEESYG